MCQSEFFCTFLTILAHISERLNFFHRFSYVAWQTIWMNQYTCLTVKNSFFETTITHSYYWCATGHGFDWTHTKIFVNGNINSRNSSLNKFSQFLIIRRANCRNIFVSFYQGKYLFSLRIIFSIGENKFLFWHILKRTDNSINPLNRRKSGK